MLIFNRINGVVMPDTNGILIEVYITHNSKYGTGDKESISPALKSVTAETVSKELSPYSESGPIDTITSTIGCGNRKIISTLKTGTMGKLLYDMSIKIAKEYFNKK